jgi:putative transposase
MNLGCEFLNIELFDNEDLKFRSKHRTKEYKVRPSPKDDWLSTLNDTKERRKNQTCMTFEIKIDKSHLNKVTENQLNIMFLDAKWFCNHIISKIRYGKNQENIFDMDYKIEKVPVKVGYRYDIRDINYLSSQMKQELMNRIKDDINGLSEKKKKGRKVGKLKFKSDVSSIPLIQYENTYKILDENYIKIQGIKQYMRVRGLNQIPKDLEIANANLIKKHGDFYLHITTYQDKKEEKVSHIRHVGLDFGIARQIVLSNGVKIEYGIPIPKSLRKKHKKLSRQERFGKNWNKTRIKIQKEYDKLNNKKTDIKNKIVHRFKDLYQIVCYQDENVKSWQIIWGRRILETSIGGIISTLTLNVRTPVEIDRFFPSTKKCSKCGNIQEIGLDERIYICKSPECKNKIDRDWNSAINLENEGLIKIGTERIELTPDEIIASTLADLKYFNNIPYVRASLVNDTGSLEA